MSPTIQVSPRGNDTGDLIDTTPAVMIGTIGGGIIGYTVSKKHKILGTLVFSSLGGWIGKAFQSSSTGK